MMRMVSSIPKIKNCTCFVSTSDRGLGDIQINNLVPLAKVSKVILLRPIVEWCLRQHPRTGLLWMPVFPVPLKKRKEKGLTCRAKVVSP